MKYFSMPADFKKETIAEYNKLNREYEDSCIIETYGNITIGNELESGRPVDILPQVDLAGLRAYIEYSQQNGIDFNYTINASYINNREFTPGGIEVIYSFLGKLHEAGVRALTITLPSLIKLVKQFPYDFSIKGSTICQANNVNKALELKRMGLERIVVDESINRKFNILKRIRDAFGEKVEIIVNSICHMDCSYRMFHYNQIAGDSVKVSSGCSNSYYPHQCLIRRYENSANLLKLTWVRPEDIKYYTAIGIHYFKLQGRPRVMKGNPVRAVESYFKEHYEGDLFDLLNLFAPVSSFNFAVDNKKMDGYIKHFYEHRDFCRNDCLACRFCQSFAKDKIDSVKLEEVHRLAEAYFREFDPLKKNIETLLTSINENKKTIAENTQPIDGEFDL
ncbi:MAG: U32 family peptidase [Acidobacteria bacterium]|jgi:collagenase-like PrtC family protease|nr:U32 family peptidase [Acidobacteriota bacterium]